MIRCWLLTLLLIGPSFAAASQEKDQEPEKIKRAVLGADTRTPTRDEVKDYGLKSPVRPEGRVITSFAEESPAKEAGLKKGDVIVGMNGNVFQSEDSLFDFLKVTPAGTKVKAKVKRAKSGDEEEVEITLGEKKVEKKGIQWQFAGLEQLDDAIAKAKKDGKTVLVGISGAET